MRQKDDALAARWQGVLAQLAAQPTRKGRQFGFSKAELFAMLRNAERTLEQRTQRFLDFTSLAAVPPHLMRRAEDLVQMLDNGNEHHAIAGHVQLGTIDDTALKELRRTLYGIFHNQSSRQTPAVRREVLAKHGLVKAMLANNDPLRQQSRDAGRAFVAAILQSLGQQYRSRFIHGVVLIRRDDGLKYRLLESCPMIVAGEMYPYQWKHDNEVNIALLLANVDPLRAAQALRFIVYYSMWRSERARELGLYGWLPQITFGNRQNGLLPTLGGKRCYYFPDFRFRPTQDVDAENERNRTSEIMQLPFFGWTVERVYLNLRERDEEMADAFLREIYPYVSANTKAIRTALDPFNEGLLSGRDAWVNGMDNAWYHLVVMRRHLPERAIPSRAQSIVDENRVDNRFEKLPGNPVNPELAKGRPSDFYYASKVVFYDIASDVGLSPQLLYHASPYNAKDVAITGVMAAALRSQLRLCRRLATLSDDPEARSVWSEEIAGLEHYLAKMSGALKQHCWSEKDGLFYNCDVSAFVPGLVERLFCRPRVTARGLRY
ncbi:MAG: MGH1-like glycoside hydrolase domain-containing protein, partial [Planctomycetota bacterium]